MTVQCHHSSLYSTPMIQVEALVAPSSQTVQAVNAWFAANNLNFTVLSPSGDWVGFEIAVHQANELFDAF